MTDQPMDYRDYLIRKQQQDRMAQQWDALFTKDEDHAAAASTHEASAGTSLLACSAVEQRP